MSLEPLRQPRDGRHPVQHGRHNVMAAASLLLGGARPGPPRRALVLQRLLLRLRIRVGTMSAGPRCAITRRRIRTCAHTTCGARDPISPEAPRTRRRAARTRARHPRTHAP